MVVAVLVVVHFRLALGAAGGGRCPAPRCLSWAVDGRVVDKVAGTSATIDRLGLRPGMTVVEIGPGPGKAAVARRAARAARRKGDRHRIATGNDRQASPQAHAGRPGQRRTDPRRRDPGACLPPAIGRRGLSVYGAGRDPGSKDGTQELLRRAAARRAAVDHRDHHGPALSDGAARSASWPSEAGFEFEDMTQHLADVHGELSPASRHCPSIVGQASA